MSATRLKKRWRPHKGQRKAVRKGARGSTALFMQPGVGKTSAMLRIFQKLRRKRKAKKMLIIAPIQVCYLVWPNEIKKWANFNRFTYSILHGIDKAKNFDPDTDIHIINREGLEWLIRKQLKGKRWPYDVLVIDESTKFKNYSSECHKLIRQKLDKFKYVYVLTGTPSPEGMKDLFAQIYLVDGGKSLGKTLKDFREDYMVPRMINMGTAKFVQWEEKKSAERQILKKISPITVTLLSEDYADLPEVVPLQVPVRVSDKVQRHFKTMQKELWMELDTYGEVLASNAGDKTLKLRQLASGFVYPESGDRSYEIVHSDKLNAYDDLVNEINAPVIVCYQFHSERAELQKRYKDMVFLTSRTKNMEAIEKKWNAGKIKQLALHPGSSSHGLNFQFGGNNIIFFSNPWEGELYEQMIYRLRRRGAAAPQIFAHHLITEGSIDGYMYNRVTGKVNRQAKTMKTLKKYFTNLS